MAAVLATDLLFTARIIDAAQRAEMELVRVGEPSALPPTDDVALLIVDWSARQPQWGHQISEWRDAASAGSAPRIVLVGPHVDLDAHADAKAAGLGPMWSRSKLITALPDLLG